MVTSHLHIGSVQLPLADFAITGTAILGIKNAGKSYAATQIAEQLLDAGIPFVAFDPIGVWRYLKVPSNTHPHAKGYKVVIAGGAQPDIPLTPASAPAIVRAAIKENVPLIVDLYDMSLSKSDWRHIVEACVRVLLHENKGVRHVFLEEAAEMVPQIVRDNQGAVYAAVEKLVRMGGNASLGVTLINQRPQELNKAVLENCECLILMRQKGRHAIKHLEKWLDTADSNTPGIVQSLPVLQASECWVWPPESTSPTRAKFDQKRAFHPDRRKPSIAPSSMADVSGFIDALNSSLVEIIQKAADNDPVVLRKRITELERKLQTKPAAPAPAAQKIDPKITQALRQIADTVKKMDAADRQHRAQMALLDDIADQIASVSLSIQATSHNSHVPRPKQTNQPQTVSKNISKIEGLNAAQQSFLRVLADRQDKTTTRNQLAVIAGYSATSAHVDNVISSLRGLCYVEGSRQELRITPSGLEAIGTNWEPLPTGTELLAHWLSKLDAGPAKMLKELASVYPEELSRDEVAARSGYSVTSAHVDNCISALRTRDLITGKRGALKASDELCG